MQVNFTGMSFPGNESADGVTMYVNLKPTASQAREKWEFRECHSREIESAGGKFMGGESAELVKVYKDCEFQQVLMRNAPETPGKFALFPALETAINHHPLKKINFL